MFLGIAVSCNINNDDTRSSLSRMEFTKDKISFMIHIFDNSNDVIFVILVEGEYVTQMHNTVKIGQLNKKNQLSTNS